MPSQKNEVAAVSAVVSSMQPFWDLAGALLAGTSGMRAAGPRYLPKFPSEEDEVYNKRLAVSVLFPAYKRTVATLAGKPFSKALTISDNLDPRLEEWLEDADRQGRDLMAFASGVFRTTIGYGMSGILVEYPVAKPKANGQPLTQAEEKEQGLRPYLVEIKPQQLLGWRATCANGAWSLTQLRFKECVTEESGPYSDREVDQIRVITPTTWEIHRQNDKQEWVLHANGINTLGVVPFVPTYGDRMSYMVSEPPLIEVAHLNVAHWQSSSDQQNILHVARVPILAATGVDETYKLVVGAQSATKLPQGADLKFVEHSGAAVEAGAKDLESLEERMRQAGAELLVIAPGKVTATQIHSENAVGMCALQQIAESFEDALDAVLDLVARWARIENKARITLFKDFGAATLAEASAKLLLEMNVAGKLSDETLHSEMQRRGILSPDADWNEEKERLAAQGPEPSGVIEPSADPVQDPAADPVVDPTSPQPAE